MDREFVCHLGPPVSFQVVGRPVDWWRREVGDFDTWLIAHLGELGRCLGMIRLEFVGRQVVVGQRYDSENGRDICVGGLRMDIVARDERGRSVIIEVQLGDSDHAHLGQLVTYAHVAQADVAVWVAASRTVEHAFLGEHLEVLSDLNERYRGQRLFCAVEVTLESEPKPVPDPDDIPVPRLHRIDLTGGRDGFRFADSTM